MSEVEVAATIEFEGARMAVNGVRRKLEGLRQLTRAAATHECCVNGGARHAAANGTFAGVPLAAERDGEFATAIHGHAPRRHIRTGGRASSPSVGAKSVQLNQKVETLAGRTGCCTGRRLRVWPRALFRLRFQLLDVREKLLNDLVGDVGARAFVFCAFAFFRGGPDHVIVR